MLSAFGRPFRSLEEMDDALFEAWERVVDPADTIVFLGDVAISPAAAAGPTPYHGRFAPALG